MAAPQAVGVANPSWITPFYAPPAGRPPNAFAAFLSGFTQTWAPRAREEYARRMANLQPQDRSKEIAALLQKRADYANEFRRQYLSLAEKSPDPFKFLADTYAAQAGGTATVSSSANRVLGDLEAAAKLSPAQADKVAEMGRTLRDVADELAAGANNPVSLKNAATSMSAGVKALLTSAEGVPGDPGSPGALAGMTPNQKLEAGRAIQTELAGVKRQIGRVMEAADALEANGDQAGADAQRALADSLMVEFNAAASKIFDPASGLGAPQGGETPDVRLTLQRGVGYDAATKSARDEALKLVKSGGGGEKSWAASIGATVEDQLAKDPTLGMLDEEIKRLRSENGKPIAPAWAVENPTEYLRAPVMSYDPLRDEIRKITANRDNDANASPMGGWASYNKAPGGRLTMADVLRGMEDEKTLHEEDGLTFPQLSAQSTTFAKKPKPQVMPGMGNDLEDLDTAPKRDTWSRR